MKLLFACAASEQGSSVPFCSRSGPTQEASWCQLCVSRVEEQITYINSAAEKIDGMKKWLEEAPPINSINDTNKADEGAKVSRHIAGCNLDLRNEGELNNKTNCSSHEDFKMGLGVSSELSPTPHAPSEVEKSEDASSKRKLPDKNPITSFNLPIAVIPSLNNRIESPHCKEPLSQNSNSLQLQDSKPSCSSSRQKDPPPHLMSLTPLNASGEQPEQLKGTYNSNRCTSCYQVPQNFYKIQENSKSISESSGDTIPPLSSHSHFKDTSQIHCTPNITDPIMTLIQIPAATDNGDNRVHIDESSSENDSRPESASGFWCGTGVGLRLNSQQQQASQSDFDSSHPPSTSKHLNGHMSLESGDGHSLTRASNSSGCGHWCSTCRVRVQFEVECVPGGSQRSPNGNRRGIRTLSFPKRVRHKVKAPTKDLNGTHKKKKSSWPFRLNCRLRSNKNESDQDTGISGLNVGCVSCVCPGYRRTETEPVYRSVLDNSNSLNNNISLHTPMVDLSQFNSDSFPIQDLEESARIERAREMAEGVEPPPGFMPLLRENSNSLALPLTYNSMIDLHVLLERSLRLGLGGQRGSGITYPSENLIRQIGPLTTEPTLFSRTVHTQVDYIHCLVPDLLAITNCTFYWGKMDRYEAERLLENRPEGTFLLRDSAQEEYLFSVSFRRYGRSLHARIEQWNHKFSFDSHDPGVFASQTVCGLIEHYKDPSCCMFFEPLLTNPLARTFPFSLQYLCRAIICSKTSYDGINNLQMPKSLKNYLKEYHYKQRVRVRHLD